jgi:ubiquinone/menaquinone biosynthesis C-methylase UbiE
MRKSHSEDLLASLGQRVYSRRKVAGQYARASGLFPAERRILNQLLPEIKGKRLLDIGVGGGRTTPALLEISRNYTAIDCSPEMVEATRQRSGLESVWCCDARDMRRFADSNFDFVLFSFNGIDHLYYEERPRVLNEVARVLRTGGIFMFSSHNRDFRDIGKLPWQCHNVKLTPSLVKESLMALLYLPRYIRLQRHQVYQRDYAIVNGNSFSYSLLVCCVTIAAQTSELLRAGFGEVQAHDLQGNIVTADDSSPWIYYVARKPVHCGGANDRQSSYRAN